MTDRFANAKPGNWVAFCDICGQKCFAHEMIKLDINTGRGGLIVCKYDADVIDYGLIPYSIPIEKPIPWARINHTDISDGTPPINLETSTSIGT